MGVIASQRRWGGDFSLMCKTGGKRNLLIPIVALHQTCEPNIGSDRSPMVLKMNNFFFFVWFLNVSNIKLYISCSSITVYD